MSETELAQRLGVVREKIALAAKNASRPVGDIQLVVVTKNHGADLVLDLLRLGESNFGENKDQEASAKAELVKSQLDSSLPTPTWHFVGQLQSNKVRSMLHYSEVLHSLDRDSLLKELIKQLAKSPDQKLKTFIELNLTEDPNRGGVNPQDLKEFAHKVSACQQLELLGVMGVVGLGVEPSLDFERIATASNLLRRSYPEAKFISAGMSGDFEEAIAFGATHLRIGTAITGKR